MKDPSNSIRQWIYNVLYGTVFYNTAPIPVYSFPPKDAAMPYIVIAEQSFTQDGTKDCYISSNEVTLEVYSSHTGNDATYKVVNAIAEDIMEILVQRQIETHGSGGGTVTTITGYNPIAITLVSSLTDRIILENSIVIFKNLNINLLLEET
jgi:hypothetical protein